MPGSITPTLAPLPLFKAYEPEGVAWMARMSHWHEPIGSGPAFSGTLYSAAQVPASAARVFVPGGAAAVAPGCRDTQHERAAPAMMPDLWTADEKLAFEV